MSDTCEQRKTRNRAISMFGSFESWAIICPILNFKGFRDDFVGYRVGGEGSLLDANNRADSEDSRKSTRKPQKFLWRVCAIVFWLKLP